MAGRYVAESEVAVGKFAEAADARRGGDAAAEVDEAGGEGVAKGLRAATQDGPADSVRRGSENQAKGGAEGLVEAQKGVCGEPGEEGAGRFGAEVEMGDSGGGENRVEAEAGKQEWMPGPGDDGAENVGAELRPMGGEWFHEVAPGAAVCAERGFSFNQLPLQRNGGAVVEGVGERRGGLNPLNVVVLEGQGVEERRAGGHGVHRGAEVVLEAGEGEFHGAGGSADGGLGFEEFDVEAGLREHDGGGKAVGACADDTGFAAAMIRGLRHGLRFADGSHCCESICKIKAVLQIMGRLEVWEKQLFWKEPGAGGVEGLHLGQRPSGNFIGDSAVISRRRSRCAQP